MATSSTKKNKEEKLDPASLERVYFMLNPLTIGTKAITKKEACELLNISYNTVRLEKLLTSWKEKVERTNKRKEELRGKPLSVEDVCYIIGEYLVYGHSIESISESTCHSRNKISVCLNDYDVPQRSVGYNYFTPKLVPEDASRVQFAVNEKAWSTNYESMCVIDKELDHPIYGKIYRVWLTDPKWQQYAYVAACELASLEHLRKLGVRL